MVEILRRGEQRASTVAVRTMEQAVLAMQQQLGWVLTQLRRIEIRRDPEMQRWLNEKRAAVADGSIWKAIENQRTPQQILDEWSGPEPA